MIPEKYNVSTLVDANLAAGRSAKTAIISGSERISYAELYSQICKMARALRGLGLRNGERVILVLADTPIFPVAFFGALRIGAVPCPINPLFKEEDYCQFVEDAGAAIVITDAANLDKTRRALVGLSGRVTILAPGKTSPGVLSLDDALSAEEGDLSPADTHRDDMAFWLYSGGSTGLPKAVIHTHQDIPWTCETYARQVLEINDSDVVLARVFYHAYGLGGGITFPISVGASSIYYPDRPTAQGLLDVIVRRRPSLLLLVPTLYKAILDEASSASADLTSLRHCISAAEPLPPETWRRWHDAYGLEILDGLGSTEMLHIFCSARKGAVRPGSSGKPVPGYELRLADEAGMPVAGNSGTLQVRGPSAAVGYWRQREKTRKTMLGEWIATGDRYRVDHDGYYWYEGRDDDMIKIGGEWVSPIAIENVLLEHPAVGDCAVVGVAIEGATRIRASIILAADRMATSQLTRELQEWCKSRLQRYQYPHAIAYVDDLPRTATGKVQRFKLRNIGPS